MLHAADAFWRPSNQMGVQNTDLAKQIGARTRGMRLWRLAPGQASTRHRHLDQHELYVLLEGTGRVRVDGELLTLAPLSALLVEPETVRQLFNDTDADALWLVAGALVLWHMRRPQQHWIEGLVFVVSLAIVWLGVALAH